MDKDSRKEKFINEFYRRWEAGEKDEILREAEELGLKEEVELIRKLSTSPTTTGESEERYSAPTEDVEGVGGIGFFDMTPLQMDDWLRDLSSMEVLDRTRILKGLGVVELACLRQIAARRNTEVNSARLTALADLRFKAIGELKSASSMDLSAQVDVRVRNFLERGVYFLFEFVKDDGARDKWIKAMGAEGF